LRQSLKKTSCNNSIFLSGSASYKFAKLAQIKALQKCVAQNVIPVAVSQTQLRWAMSGCPNEIFNWQRSYHPRVTRKSHGTTEEVYKLAKLAQIKALQKRVTQSVIPVAVSQTQLRWAMSGCPNEIFNWLRSYHPGVTPKSHRTTEEEK
jgi:hypothetical protein